MMFFGGWMIIVWIVIVGLIVWGVINMTRRSGSPTDPGSKQTPLEIVKERYARGEITKEEFERIKKELM